MKINNFKIFEYTFLAIGLISFVGFFWLFRFDDSKKIALLGIYALVYILWGIIHHKIDNRLSFSILAEYFLIALFVFLLVFTAIIV